MRLAESGLADVIFTPMIYEPTKLFKPEDGYYGYMFAIIRHPVERAVHMFYYLKQATWDPAYRKEFEKMNIDAYARSSFVENNWLTRMLTNHKGGELTNEHVNAAKEMLRRKFLVGVFTDMKFSIKRFEKRFGWYAGNKDAEECEKNIIAEKMEIYRDNPKVEEGSATYELLLKQNKYDMEIYNFAELLFLNQKSKQVKETNLLN